MAQGEPLEFELDDEDLKLFNDEAEEQLELLDTALVQLEGEHESELVQQIFRAAHTLKGSSATIGHTRMAALTHGMETVLDAVRQNRLEASSEVVDALLSSLDTLRMLLDEVNTKVDSGADITGHEAALKAVLDEGASKSPAETPERPRGATRTERLAADALAAVRVEISDGSAAFLIEIAIGRDCQLPSIRCFQVIQELDAKGKVYASWPSREDIEAGAGDHQLAAVIVTDEPDSSLTGALNEVSDIANVAVRALDAKSAGEPMELVVPEETAEGAATPKLDIVPTVGDASAAAAPRKLATSVRIDVERLDGLMNLVGELVIDRTRLEQVRDQLREVLREANLGELTENFEETTAHLARITDELQEEIMRSRMLPVRSVLTRLPRLIRDVASKTGKKVELTTSGEDTELDRSVTEEISDPLVHIIRNAVDHGVELPEDRVAAGKPETGNIAVTAWNQETYIYLSIKDDGAGIDADVLRRKAVEKGLVGREAAEAATPEEALNYIFLPGLSTAKVVSDVSGRGVGMDIVRTNIERLNGSVKVSSELGKGSEFIIQLPLTLATTKALMVSANDTVYALPLVSVTEALSEDEADLQTVDGDLTLRLRGKLLPTFELAETLGDEATPDNSETRFLVAARHGLREVAFRVDKLLGEQDVVVKSLGDLIGTRDGISGATILGDGRLGLIIDTASLISGRELREARAMLAS
jgi:two-component system, chemotaxis family, sensor kinase CheA